MHTTRILTYIGIYLAMGAIVASIWRLTSCYFAIKPRYSLPQPDFFGIFNEIILWPFLLIFLLLLFIESLVDLLCEIGNCALWFFKKRRKK